jgi:hypothetical protein
VTALSRVLVIEFSFWIATIREQSGESNMIMNQIEKLCQLLITAELDLGWITDSPANESCLIAFENRKSTFTFTVTVRAIVVLLRCLSCLMVIDQDLLGTVVGLAIVIGDLRVNEGLWLTYSYE